MRGRDFYRRHAIERMRDPDQEARTAEARAALQQRFEINLARVTTPETLAAMLSLSGPSRGGADVG